MLIGIWILYDLGWKLKIIVGICLTINVIFSMTVVLCSNMLALKTKFHNSSIRIKGHNTSLIIEYMKITVFWYSISIRFKTQKKWTFNPKQIQLKFMSGILPRKPANYQYPLLFRCRLSNKWSTPKWKFHLSNRFSIVMAGNFPVIKW